MSGKSSNYDVIVFLSFQQKCNPISEQSPRFLLLGLQFLALIDALQFVLFDMIEAAFDDFSYDAQFSHHGGTGAAQIMWCPAATG